MPCHSVDYPEQSDIEKEIIKILYIEDELAGDELIFSYSHPRIVTQELSQDNLGRLTNEICKLIHSRESVHEFSFYFQKWWLEHQINDHIHLHEKFHNELDKEHFYSELNDYEKNLFDLSSLIKSLLDDLIKSTNFKMKELKSEPNENRKSFIQNVHFLNILSFLTGSLCRIDNKKIKMDGNHNFFSIKEIGRFFKDNFGISILKLLSMELYNHLDQSLKRFAVCNLEKGNTSLFASSLNHYFEKNNLSMITEGYIEKLIMILKKLKEI